MIKKLIDLLDIDVETPAMQAWWILLAIILLIALLVCTFAIVGGLVVLCINFPLVGLALALPVVAFFLIWWRCREAAKPEPPTM